MALNPNPAPLEGIREVERRLNEEIAKMEEAGLTGLVTAAEFIKAESQKLCPVVTGNLRTSAFVTWGGGINASGSRIEGEFKNPIGKTGIKEAREIERTQAKLASLARVSASSEPMVEILHGVVYAVAVHENPRSGITGGKNATGTRIYKPGTYSTVGQWKFLETAMKANESRILDIIRRAVEIK